RTCAPSSRRWPSTPPPVRRRDSPVPICRSAASGAPTNACLSRLSCAVFHPQDLAMTQIGTPLSPTATRVLFLGSGELGKEVAIELMRLGCEVIAVDRYANAPAMQVAHRSHVINMLDGAAVRAVVEQEKPHLIVPEIEA